MGKKRVVVTGVGVVAPNGVGKEAFWQALMQGLSGVRPIRRFDPHLSPTRIAGELDGFAAAGVHAGPDGGARGALQGGLL